MTYDAIEPGVLETDAVPVRTMKESDLAALVRIDAAASGRKRPKYFETMLERSLRLSGLQVSLVAELDGAVAGFLIASLNYGEFGISEPVASLEAIGVDVSVRRHRIARSLMRQLRRNLGAIGVRTIRTEVEWSEFDLLAFFRSERFVPAARLCLECTIDPTAPGDA